MANLSQVLHQQQVPLESLFWALVDIDDSQYARYTTDWVSCYLTTLGVYNDGLWSAFQATNFKDLQQQLWTSHTPLQLITVPMKNMSYRHDLGSQIRQNARHVLLVHYKGSLLLEDLAIGVTGGAYPATLLQEDQFIYPFTYWIFDSEAFMKLLCSVDLKKKTRIYATSLLDRQASIQSFKHQLLINTVQKNDINELGRTNLYEESYYYRAFFMSLPSIDSLMSIHQEKNRNILSKFKGLFLRMQYCNTTDEIEKLQHQAIDNINQLNILDHEFYDAFAKHIQ